MASKKTDRCAELEAENAALRAELLDTQKDLLAAQKELLTLKPVAKAPVAAAASAPTLAPGEVWLGCRSNGCKSKKHKVEGVGNNKLYVCVVCSNTQAISVGGGINI